MEVNCLLKGICKEQNTEKCHIVCPSYVAMHGKSGKGGRVYASLIPVEYHFYTVNNLPIQEEQTEAYKLIQQYLATLERQFKNERIKSLYLWSREPGTGKTTTGAALANEYLIRHYVGSINRKLQPLQRPVFFFDVNEWQQLYNGFARGGIPKTLAEQNSYDYYTREKHAKEAPFTIFDDIGVRSATEAFRSDLHSVINYRVSNRLPAVYTSNVHVDELSNIYDERLADRIREECFVIHFEGSSNRQLRKGGK